MFIRFVFSGYGSVRGIGVRIGVKQMGIFVIRHKYRFADFSVVIMVAAGVVWTVLNYNIFHDAVGNPQPGEKLEFDELMLTCGVLFAGLFWAVQRLRRERREMDRRARIEHEMRVLAFQDALTGLPNRRRFDEQLHTVLATAPPGEGAHAVLMMDLNGFKRINDVFGHAIGDEVLMHVGTRLSRAIRHADLVARLGGDEFAILAPQLTSPEAATSLALRVIDAFKSPVITGAHEHTVGVGIGISISPQDATEAGELLRKADIALYRAKQQTGSSLRFFEEEMDAHVRERDHLERAVRAAIAKGTIQVFYQPQMDLKSGEVVQFEALARWVDPLLGNITPDRFIPIAEEIGLISKLTATLLERACKEAASWPSHVTLAFNLSPVMLGDPLLAFTVVAILGRTGLSPKRLELEITENALVRDLEAARVALGMLREAGVKIALDDFGTGCSTLYHLQSIKLDKIKIDRAFIARMNEQDDSAKIVRAMIGLGAGLGLSVTAEGVETELQRRLLVEQGCDQAQGFLYSAAVSAADVHRLIGSQSGTRRLPNATREAGRG